MRQMKTRVLSGLPLLLMPAWALALNLGNVTLKSEPGEPLAAEIAVTDIAAEVRDSLSVSLADMEGFRWAGIEWTPTLDRLQFELQRGTGDALSIRISTDEALPVARLHILLTVAWERGRLFREYTLELEPAPQTAAQPATPAAGPDLLIVTDNADAEPDDTPAAIRQPDSYDVVRGDTLWEIARELRPQQSVTINQMMLALLRANPQAFSEDNINWLRAGATLSIPAASELQALSAAQAYAEVLAQNNVWRLTRGYPPLAAEPQQSPQARASAAELRLAPLSDESPEAQQAGAVSAPAQAEEQAQQQTHALTLANEQLSRENTELADRLVTAEGAIDELKRLVEIKDDELAAIQEQRIQAQAEPGPGLPAQAQALFAALPELARSHWRIASACVLALLILLGWLLLRIKTAHPKGLASPAASIRSDFPDALKRTGNNTDMSAAPTKAGEAAEPELFADKDKDEEAKAPEFFAGEDKDEDTEAPELFMDKDEAEQAEELGLFTRKDQDIAVEELEFPVLERAGGQNEEPEPEDEEEAEDLVWNKLELARAYLDLGDTENVHSILDEVLAEGNAAQREEARQLLQRADADGDPGAA